MRTVEREGTDTGSLPRSSLITLSVWAHLASTESEETLNIKEVVTLQRQGESATRDNKHLH